jgi:putative aldouronate transport system permease protein
MHAVKRTDTGGNEYMTALSQPQVQSHDPGKERFHLSSLFCWRIVQVLSVLVLATLFLPMAGIESIAGQKNLSISGFSILTGSHGLSAQLDKINLDAQGTMLMAVLFMVATAALALIRFNKASFYTLPLALCAMVEVLIAAGMLTWLVKKGGETLFGVRLMILLEALIILFTFLAVVLKRVNARTGDFKSHLALFAMLIPGMVYLLGFAYLPMPGILLAFKKYVVAGTNVFENFFKSKWVGFDNFKFLFQTPDAWEITRNTVGYNLGFMFIGLIFSVGLAIAITELPNRRLAKAYQTAYFLPYFLSWMVVAYLVFALLNYDLGVLNKVLGSFGLESVNWYLEPKYWPFIFVISNLWKYTGNGSIIYIATITGFDTEIYEAASIDGANKWKQIRLITLPMLVPMMILLSILGVGRIFSADLGLFFSLPMGSGPLRPVSNVIDVYVFNALRAGTNIGIPGAAALFQSVVGFVLVLTTNAITRKMSDNALF